MRWRHGVPIASISGGDDATWHWKTPAQTLQNHPEGARKKLSLSNRTDGLLWIQYPKLSSSWPNWVYHFCPSHHGLRCLHSPFESTQNSLCKRNSVRHGGSKFARRANFKVYERNAAHSQTELERSQRLIVLEPLGYAISQNMVISFGPVDGEVSKVECVCSPSTFVLRESQLFCFVFVLFSKVLWGAESLKRKRTAAGPHAPWGLTLVSPRRSCVSPQTCYVCCNCNKNN